MNLDQIRQHVGPFAYALARGRGHSEVLLPYYPRIWVENLEVTNHVRSLTYGTDIGDFTMLVQQGWPVFSRGSRVYVKAATALGRKLVGFINNVVVNERAGELATMEVYFNNEARQDHVG